MFSSCVFDLYALQISFTRLSLVDRPPALLTMDPRLFILSPLGRMSFALAQICLTGACLFMDLCKSLTEYVSPPNKAPVHIMIIII